MRWSIVEGDLMNQPADVIINSWNRNVIPWWLLLPQGVSDAIKKKGGLAPLRELGRVGPIPLGGAVHTSAGRLPYKAIIHVAGINLLWTASEKSIALSVRNAVALADHLGFRSAAFPLIGAGSGRFNEEEAEKLITQTFDTLNSPLEAVLVRFRPPQERAR